ncbi:helix-turn-helix domain-containing protein [Tenacibaculum sp.]|uniref:helix-turn-helix domain-containing protein n=1 Tax=Tenacibaculum sp. TaxID=1906242 RepID=UPI003D0C7938
MFHFDKNFGLFVGDLTTNEFHKHYALQISVSEKPNMNLASKDGTEKSGDSFFVSSRVEHKLLSPKTQLTILINPLSSLGHQLYINYGELNVSILETGFKNKLVSILSKFNTSEINFKELCTLVTDTLNEYQCSCKIENHSNDDRIIKALEFFDDNFEKVYSLEEIAEICCLSPSRFLHLFKEKTGLNFRRYQLWNKMIKSLPFLSVNSITDTAHMFGFTDSSHYTRTFKETFGLTPKFMVQKNSQFIQV